MLVLDFLDHCDIADCYCGTLSLGWPFFAKGLGYFAKVLSFCMKMPGITHLTGQLSMAVHLIWYGSVPFLPSVFSLSLNPWEAPDWQVIAIDADVKQVITSWLQTLDNTDFTLEYKTWYHCGANPKMLPWLRWGLLHTICFTLIKVTITSTEFATLFCETSLYIHCSLNRWIPKYWMFWMVGFLCHLLIIFAMNYLF